MSHAIDYLLERGITKETATQNHLEFDLAPLDQNRIISRLNPGCVPLWSLAKELLWLPIRSNDLVSSWIARPFPTLVNGSKLVTPKAGIAPPFVPVGVPGLAHGLPLINTEGPVKALAPLRPALPLSALTESGALQPKLPAESLFYGRKSLASAMQRFKILFSCEDSGGDSGELINISPASG